MSMIFRTMIIAISLILYSPYPSQAADIKCSECGMMATMESKFIAKITQGGASLYFCDIGDLFSYLKRKGTKDSNPEVKDYVTGEWINAEKAYYVHAEQKFKTPMGWGIAAFQDVKSAEEFGTPANFNATAKALK